MQLRTVPGGCPQAAHCSGRLSSAPPTAAPLDCKAGGLHSLRRSMRKCKCGSSPGPACAARLSRASTRPDVAQRSPARRCSRARPRPAQAGIGASFGGACAFADNYERELAGFLVATGGPRLWTFVFPAMPDAQRQPSPLSLPFATCLEGTLCQAVPWAMAPVPPSQHCAATGQLRDPAGSASRPRLTGRNEVEVGTPPETQTSGDRSYKQLSPWEDTSCAHYS